MVKKKEKPSQAKNHSTGKNITKAKRSGENPKGFPKPVKIETSSRSE